jgi:hypothetical protein
MTTKPVAYYHPDRECETIIVGEPAWIFGVVDHPNPHKIGDYVVTSRVVKSVDRTIDGDKIFETENTIYKPISCRQDLLEEVSPPL